MEESDGTLQQAENIIELQSRMQELETEKIRICDEFNTQRAKMKDLFLQKESELAAQREETLLLSQTVKKLQQELDEAKSSLMAKGLSGMEVEIRKADEEIATLQKLVHETIEESSCSKTRHDAEVECLQLVIQELRSEVAELKRQNQYSPHHITQEHSLAPTNVLNALTKGIVKKLGADSFSSQDSLDDSCKRQYDDIEDSCSLLQPLEDQIKALKEKLRSTDEQLQKCKECGHNEGTYYKLDGLENSSQTEKEATCDMCQNYEAQLVSEQKNYDELVVQVAAAQKAAERHKEDLIKEIGFRKEMEEKWNEKREEVKCQVAELTMSTECAEQDLKELRQIFSKSCSEFKTTLSKLTKDREMIYEEIRKLQFENDNLVGKYAIHSQELQSQAIDLPNTVEELHELILKNNEELIRAKIGKECAEANVSSLQTNILLLKDQMAHEQNQKECLENNLLQEINVLKEKNRQLEKEMKMFRTSQGSITEMKEQIDDLLITNKQYVEVNNELKSKVYALQQELDTSETVQKDFVLLSQSLQVQLEKIRASDSQVRWQHEEDVNTCPTCHSNFSNSRKKEHCRHCGQIFCHQCLSRVVKSGPNMRPSKVCDVCHTLLVQSSAPYFSEAPPPT
ncbi:hypothetical protein WA026_000428 [Henosepilachna vigintioctopunctata]|uniref:Rab GTPase-binding effector protein 1 n=1 Tax=Henosepilachna vigintioctopunctata TaxID=420089 RepID=A0AAW1V4X5_9CUCU